MSIRRREFLKEAAAAAGLVFVRCGLGGGAAAQSVRAAGVRRQVTAPLSARSTAARTSSGPATGTVPVTVPSNGEVTFSVRPFAAACHVPPISIVISAYSPVSGVGVR